MKNSWQITFHSTRIGLARGHPWKSIIKIRAFISDLDFKKQMEYFNRCPFLLFCLFFMKGSDSHVKDSHFFKSSAKHD